MRNVADTIINPHGDYWLCGWMNRIVSATKVRRVAPCPILLFSSESIDSAVIPCFRHLSLDYIGALSAFHYDDGNGGLIGVRPESDWYSLTLVASLPAIAVMDFPPSGQENPAPTNANPF